jgi:thiol-disulfide isomerase/thioredoxin
LVATIVIAASAAFAFPAAAGNEADRLRQLTRAFAELDVRDMAGRRWTAADLRGRVVVMDFWATWCPPCWKELPWLRRIHEKDPARIQVLGVSLDVTDRRTLVAWLNRQRVEWPQVWETHGYESALAERFGVGALPTTLVIDRYGRVVAMNLRGAKLVAAVDTLLAEDETTRGR